MDYVDLEGLSADDLDILFEPNPYSYDSTVTDPSLPPSPFVQVMREQEERFFAFFPEARKHAQYRKHRRAEILAFLAARNIKYGARIEPSSETLPTVPCVSPMNTGRDIQRGELTHFECQLQATGSTFESPSDFHRQQPQVAISSSYVTVDYASHAHITSPQQLEPPHKLIYDDVPELVPVDPSVYYQMQEGKGSPKQLPLHQIDEGHETKAQNTSASSTIPRQRRKPQPSPHHDRHPEEIQQRSMEEASVSQPINDQILSNKKARDNRRSRHRASTPGPLYSGRSRSNKNSNLSTGLAWNSKRRTSTGSTPAPGKRQQSDRKPTLACLFCRGRKIACGAPLPGSVDKTCNQCQRRSLHCEFPAESRRGMRKRKLSNGSDDGTDDQSLPGESILVP